MASWIEVANEADVPPGTMIGVETDQADLLIANVHGEYFATQAQCTHQGGPLPEGSLSVAVLTCPWHGSRFDVRTGAVLGPPARRPLQTYPAKAEGGKVLVEMP